MGYNLIIADLALAELADVVVFIAQSSSLRAQKYKSDVMTKIAKLERDPYLGKPHTIGKLRKLGYRKLVVESHTAHYLVNENKKQVHVIRILHNTMDEKRHLKNT